MNGGLRGSGEVNIVLKRRGTTLSRIGNRCGVRPSGDGCKALRLQEEDLVVLRIDDVEASPCSQKPADRVRGGTGHLSQLLSSDRKVKNYTPPGGTPHSLAEVHEQSRETQLHTQKGQILNAGQVPFDSLRH